MKALLYKDFCLVRKQMRLFLPVFLVLLLFPLRFFFGGIDLCLAPILGLTIPFLLTSYDQQSKWSQYTRMLPYSLRDLVLSRCLICWGVTLLASVLSLGSCLLFAPDHQLSRDTLMALAWLTAFVLVIQAVSLPLLFRIGVIHGQVVAIAVLLVILLVVFNLLCWMNFSNPWAALPAFLDAMISTAPAALLIALAMNIIAVPVAIQQYARRIG